MSERSPAERSDKAPFATARPADPPTPEQHSIGRSVVLHLLPGALITLFFALTAPVARGLRRPRLVCREPRQWAKALSVSGSTPAE